MLQHVFIRSRVNLSPSPQATSHQNLNNGQKFYYQLQSSLSALSGVNAAASPSPSNNDSNAPKHSINQLSLNNKSSTDYQNSKSMRTFVKRQAFSKSFSVYFRKQQHQQYKQS